MKDREINDPDGSTVAVMAEPVPVRRIRLTPRRRWLPQLGQQAGAFLLSSPPTVLSIGDAGHESTAG